MITIDGASPLTSINPVLSVVIGTEIRLHPRVQANEERTGAYADFGNVCCCVTGVKDLTPIFRIDLTVGPTWYFPWQTTEHGYFSYDNGITWARMGNAASFGSGVVYLSHNAPFTQDSVMFARNARVGSNRIAAWLADTSWQNGKLSNLIGGSAYIVGTIAAQTDDLGRTIPPQPMHAFGIKNGASSKPIIIFTGGCHAAEDYGQECLMKGVEWLCGADVRAATLRETFDFLIFPLINPSGRMGGHYRGQFVYNGPSVPVGGVGNDLNRHFTDIPAPFDSISVPRGVMEAEIAGHVLSVLLDWHTGSGSPGPNGPPYNAYSDQALESAFVLRLAANNSTGRADNYLAPTPAGIHTWGQDRGALISTVIEHAQASALLPPALTSSQIELGRGVMLSLYDLIPQLLPAPAPDEYDALIARMNTLKTEISMSAPTSAQAQEMIDIGNELVVIGNDILGTPPIVPPVVPPSSGSVVYVTTQETPLPDGPNQFQWKFASNSNIFRAAVGSTAWTQMPGYTGKLARDSAGQIMHFGGNGKWYRWTGSGWAESPPPV